MSASGSPEPLRGLPPVDVAADIEARDALEAKLRAAVDDPEAFAAVERELAELDRQGRRLAIKDDLAAEQRAKAERDARIARKREHAMLAAAHKEATRSLSAKLDADTAALGKTYTDLKAEHDAYRAVSAATMGDELAGADQWLMVEQAQWLAMKWAGLPVPRTETTREAPQPVAEVVQQAAEGPTTELKRKARTDAVLAAALEGIAL